MHIVVKNFRYLVRTKITLHTLLYLLFLGTESRFPTSPLPSGLTPATAGNTSTTRQSAAAAAAK